MNIKQLISLILLPVVYSTSQSATYCATNATEFQSALTSAQNNSQHDVIKLTTGSFVTPGVEFSYQENNGFDLDISGGWSLFFNNPCGQQLSGDTLATVLDGNSLTRVLRIRTSLSAEIKLSNLFFINGNLGGTQRGGGLYMYSSQNDHVGNITVENTAFINNEAEFSGAVSISGGYNIKLRNNLIVANHSRSNGSISLIQNDSNGVYFTNNTVISNTTDSDVTGAGLYIYISGTTQSLVVNNVLWNNGDSDFRLGGEPSGMYLKYNNIGAKIGGIPGVEVGNFSLPPRFDSGFLNYTPSVISPMVNAGIKPCNICPIPLPFDQLWTLGDSDAVGEARTQQGRVDIGAYESPYMPDLIFMNGAE